MDSLVQLPALPLRSCITHYAGLRVDGMAAGHVQAGLPSRHAHLIISLAGPIEVVGMPDPRQKPGAFYALVNGLQDAPAFVTGSGRMDMLHLFLKPLGVHALFGLPCAELANRVVELADVWGRASAASLMDRLHAAATWQERFAVLDAVFLRRLHPVKARGEVAWAWKQLAQSRGLVQVRDLASAVGWSRRHFSEQFANTLGVPPKTLARIFRFEHACRVLMDTRPPLADVAAHCGFQDQAHMTREWKALAGSTPGVWLSNELPFLQDYELAGGDDERAAFNATRAHRA